jgi:hypothetical protein
MGHATAEAVIRAGLELVPFSFTGQSEAVAVGNVGVSGYPVELIGPEQRQEAMEKVLAAYPSIIIIDFTLPQAVNGNLSTGALGDGLLLPGGRGGRTKLRRTKTACKTKHARMHARVHVHICNYVIRQYGASTCGPVCSIHKCVRVAEVEHRLMSECKACGLS